MPSAERAAAVLSFENYLQILGLSPPALAESQSCELCDGTSATPIRDRVLIGDGRWVRLRVVACDRCGLLFQRPRFTSDFYLDYYASCYRRITTGQARPAMTYVEDQVRRGERLAAALADYLPSRGCLLDLGCAAGGMMKPFLDAGWSGLGVDPDVAAIDYGREHLGLPLQAKAAEEFDAEAGPFDLVLITGSLEHVADPNQVLRRAHDAAAPDACLLIEGWGLAQARQTLGLGHNQRRFLTLTTIQLFMRKHGWRPILVTPEPLSGPTRPGSVFVLGRRVEHGAEPSHLTSIAADLRDPPEETLQRLSGWRIG